MTLELATRVAERTVRCSFTIWGFGVGGALSGLVRAGEATGTPAFVDRVAQLVEPALHAPPSPADHLISVEALRALGRARPRVAIGPTCERWADVVLHAPRVAAGGPQVHRPDQPRWTSTIWVDCMHTDGPGLAALGYREQALAYAASYAAVLQRDDGLFQHGYDACAGRGNGVAWGRGQGWALLGLVDTLTAVGEAAAGPRSEGGETEDDAVLRARLARLVEAMAAYELDGRWRTVIDDPAAPVENSVSAFAAHAIGRAALRGLVDRGFSSMADRAFEAAVAAVRHGRLPVSEASPIGTAASYRDRALGVFPWGQGPLLHAILDRCEGTG